MSCIALITGSLSLHLHWQTFKNAWLSQNLYRLKSNKTFTMCIESVWHFECGNLSVFFEGQIYIYIYILFCIENVYWWFHLHWSQMPVHVFSPCWELKLRHPFPWTKNMAPQNVQKTTVNECKCHWLWCKGPQGGTASASWTIEMQLEVSAFMS